MPPHSNHDLMNVQALAVLAMFFEPSSLPSLSQRLAFEKQQGSEELVVGCLELLLGPSMQVVPSLASMVAAVVEVLIAEVDVMVVLVVAAVVVLCGFVRVGIVLVLVVGIVLVLFAQQI